MDNKELLEHIRIFREKINVNKLIAFVGAGVSRNVKGMPSWFELIQKMADAIKYSKCVNCGHKKDKCEEKCDFKDDYSQDEFLKIPQFVYNIDRDLYERVINDTVGKGEMDAPLSNAIFSLNPAHIITTNYDKLIESCRNVRRENYQVIVEDRDLLVAEKSKYIIKMHGDITDLNTIILKESDYLEYSQRHVLIETFVKALLADHMILFLGYSLNDYNIKLIISWINFIRAQSGAFDAETRIGFIVLDDESISETEINYFKNNNIGVINLRNMPLIDKVPDELTDEIGQRLFSFLSTISDASCERFLGQSLLYDDAVNFLEKFSFVRCEYICKTINLKNYTLDGQELRLFIEIDFDELIRYMQSDAPNAPTLNRLFIDAGIIIITFKSHDGYKQHKLIGDIDLLAENKYYQLYLSNRYKELLEFCDVTIEEFWREPCFYINLVCGYSHPISQRYAIVSLDKLTVEEKIAYLFNKAVLETRKTHNINSQAIQDYINAIPDKHFGEGFKQYLDTFEGNTQDLLTIKKALLKLKEQYASNTIFWGCSSLNQLLKIKKIAMDYYYFYYCNNLFHIGFSMPKSVLKVYAEAIICTNSEYELSRESIWGNPSSKETYPIDVVDFGILTKMLSVKELYEIFAQYHVSSLNFSDGAIEICIDSVVNMVKSVIELKLLNQIPNVSSALINAFVCLVHTELAESQKMRLSYAVIQLLQNKEFSEYFFSVQFPEWRKSAESLLQLMKHISIDSDWEALENFFRNPRLEDYIANSNLYTLQDIIFYLVGSNATEYQERIKEKVIEFPERIRCKIIRLVKKILIEEDIKKEFITFISQNFDNLDSDDIIDFAFDGWLEISTEISNNIFNKALKIKESQTPGVKSYPDPLENQLELIYLLHITDFIKDISPLKLIDEKSDFLRFFFDDPQLNYSEIDLSNYMWQNIARSFKYQEKFKDHKDDLIPRIQKRIEIDVATEFERKMLYGVLLDDVF